MCSVWSKRNFGKKKFKNRLSVILIHFKLNEESSATWKFSKNCQLFVHSLLKTGVNMIYKDCQTVVFLKFLESVPNKIIFLSPFTGFPFKCFLHKLTQCHSSNTICILRESGSIFFPSQFTMPLTGVLYYLLRHRKVAQEKIMDLDIFAEHGQRTSVLWIVELY